MTLNLSLLQREVCMYTLHRKCLRTGCWRDNAWTEEREYFVYWSDLHKWGFCNCYIIPDVVKTKRRKKKWTKWATEIDHTWEVRSIKCHKNLAWEFSRI